MDVADPALEGEESTPGVEQLEGAVPLEIALAQQAPFLEMMRRQRQEMQMREVRELVAGLQTQLVRAQNALDLLQNRVEEILHGR